MRGVGSDVHLWKVQVDLPSASEIETWICCALRRDIQHPWGRSERSETDLYGPQRVEEEAQHDQTLMNKYGNPISQTTTNFTHMGIKNE